MCDTACLVTPSAVLFGKNSDREPGEAQRVELVPAARGGGGTVRCTHVTVRQVERRRAVLVSRPSWMWGAEIGANDAGVVGGNEAVFTRFPVPREGLTGMDLLRLALERADSAAAAVDHVIQVLGEERQGGAMGHRDRSFRYFSSFLFADATEAWVLETAGPYWATERVRGPRAISNELSIGVPDRAHAGAADEARRRGWLRAGETFEFARCFGSRLHPPLTGAGRRRACVEGALATDPHPDERTLLRALRDHGARHPARGLRLEAPCAHASWPPTRWAGQTTASQVSVLMPGRAAHWLTATSSPCLSVFKPASLAVEPTAYGEPAPERADERSLWWRHERLHRAVLEDYEPRRARIEAARERLERELLAATDVAAAWAAHHAAVVDWAEAARAVPARPPLRDAAFRAWWRRRAALDFA
ncbi:MAG: hypothetical protein IT376_00330 [Polyangiaceae bacterium]|nr:hypothetical protein [Polyangiaceae bacterium]